MIKKYFPVILLWLLIMIFFYPVLKGLLPVPADTIAGMYHPWRDFFAGSFPSGVPFKNFQITDAVRQQYPWRELVVSILKRGELPLWNPYNFAGYPLLANLQSAPFYPLNLLYWILPFSVSWTVQVILQLILGSAFMYFYLSNLIYDRKSAVFGALVFSFCGFSVAWLPWNTTVQTFIWLPLILLAVDRIYSGKNLVIWSAVFVFGLLSGLFAGYLQPFFYISVLTGIYLFWRAVTFRNFKKLWLFSALVAVFLLIGSVQWLPTLKFILLSARSLDQANWTRPDWFLPWQNLAQFIAPDFFGNPATLNYFGIWNYQEFIGYVGIVPLILALVAAVKIRKLKAGFFLALLLISLSFTLKTPWSILPYKFQLPFFATAQPSRLIMLVDFSLAVLSAFGFKYFSENKPDKKIMFGLTGVVFFSVISLVLLTFLVSDPDLVNISRRNLILPAGITLISAILLLCGLIIENRNFKRSILVLLFLLTFFDLYRFAAKYSVFSDNSYLYPSTKITRFLRENTSTDYSRFMAVDDRIFPPNFNIHYRLLSVDGYDPLYLQTYGELIAASERGRSDISLPWGFNRILVPKNWQSKIMDLMGVKYVLSLSEIQSPGLTEVAREGNTIVYQNSQAFPRAFLVNTVVSESTKGKVLNNMFIRDLKTTAVIQGDFQSEGLATGSAKIEKYTENEVDILTVSPKNSFLVLSDSFYPGWKVFVDGREEKIYLTDYNFRGVSLISGNHRVIFKYNNVF